MRNAFNDVLGFILLVGGMVLVVVELLIVGGSQRAAKENAEAICMYCRDESDAVCAQCPNRKVHDRMVERLAAEGVEA
jgi:hypothetical protein